MKKILYLLILLLLVFSPIYANDWEDGYLKGYADALAGKPNIVTSKDEDESSNTNDYGIWNIEYFVDEFGDPTSNCFISQKLYGNGTFSNSATSNSQLLWFFLIDSRVAIKLYEYGSAPSVGGSSKIEAYEMLVKESDGETHFYYLDRGSDRLYLESKYIADFLTILKKEKPIKIVIRDSSNYSRTSYNLGYFDPKGFNAIYKYLSEHDHI